MVSIAEVELFIVRNRLTILSQPAAFTSVSLAVVLLEVSNPVYPCITITSSYGIYC